MLAFYQNLIQHLDAIDDCLEKGRVISGLCLLYAGIDVVASLERMPKEGTRAAFVRWVDENMLKERPMPCSALDLYAARCGILHSFTPDSHLSRERRARKIIYSWGPAKAEDLTKATKFLGEPKLRFTFAN